VALLPNVTCNLRHPMSLRHPVPAREQIYIYIYKYVCVCFSIDPVFTTSTSIELTSGKFIRFLLQLANKYVYACVCVSNEPIFTAFTIAQMIKELTFEKFYNQSIRSCEQIHPFICKSLNRQYISYIY